MINKFKKLISIVLTIASLLIAGSAFAVTGAGSPGAGGIGTPSQWVNKSGQLYTNPANAIINVGGCNGCGGGGGPVTGLTGNPTEVVYIDNAGNGTGDALATRDSVTNVTNFGRAVSADVMTSFGLTSSFLGGLSTSYLSVTDSALSTSAHVIAADLTPFGGDSTVSGIIAKDSAGNNQTFLMYPDGLSGAITDGTNETVLELDATEVGFDYNDGTSIQTRVKSNGNGASLIYIDTPTINNEWRVGASGAAFYKGNTLQYKMPVSDGTLGQAMVTDGSGNVSFQTISTIPTLLQDQIGFGNASNVLDGDDAFKYRSSNYDFIQTIPNNTGNGGLITSPLVFGAISHSGGLDDITLTWGASDYTSKKYGGILVVKITSTGTPDEFTWYYTDLYSETIGTGANIPITSGVPYVLNDIHGNKIGAIEFANDTGHALNETWTTSASTAALSPWGQHLQDSDGETYVLSNPPTGLFSFGASTNVTNNLFGNGTRLQIDDKIAELQLFAKKYFRIKNPGGDTLVLADMATYDWSQYGAFKVREVSTGTLYFSVDTQTATTSIGDIQNIGTNTLLTVNANSRLITGEVEDGLGGKYTLNGNGTSKFFGFSADDGADYTGFVRATDNSTYIQSQDSNTGVINVWQTTATSLIGSSTDGVNTMNIQVLPTYASILGSTNNTGITIDDVTQLVTITNVPTYADDAAAITGGLTTGMLYKTTTGGITSLNIVP